MIKALLFIFATVLFSAHHAAANDKCVCRDCKKFKQYCGVHEVSRSQCENMARGTCAEMAQDPAMPPPVPKAARHKTVKDAHTAVHTTKGSLRGHAPVGDPWEHVGLLPFRRYSPMGTYVEGEEKKRREEEGRGEENLLLLFGVLCDVVCATCTTCTTAVRARAVYVLIRVRDFPSSLVTRSTNTRGARTSSRCWPVTRAPRAATRARRRTRHSRTTSI